MLEIAAYIVWGVCGIIALSLPLCSHVNKAESPGYYMRAFRDGFVIALGPISLLVCMAKCLANSCSHKKGEE